MDLSKIKQILGSGEISADQVNPMINALKTQDLDKLSGLEKESLRAVINNMLVLSQDNNSGAHLYSPQKAEELLSALG